jgi:hypothetical protein
VCGNSARTDLRGRTPARAFPTATPLRARSVQESTGVARWNLFIPGRFFSPIPRALTVSLAPGVPL